MSIFRAYDIRGIYGKELTDGVAEGVSKAFANLMRARKVVVAMDVRDDSPKLKAAAIRGLLSQGCTVFDLGLIPVPAFYYFIVKYKVRAGIYITGSHDPAGYDGLKLCGPKAIDLTYETGIAKLEKLYKKSYPERSGGNVIAKDVSEEYQSQLLKKFDIKRPLHVVIDAGNGSFSEIAPRVFEEMGFEVTRLFCEFDGSFPNRSPEPTDKNLKELKRKVKEVGADLGIAYDADGDRSVFVDEKGSVISPDIILMLFARELLRKGDTLVATVACTRALDGLAKKFGWKMIWIRVGRSYVKQKMFETKAPLAGEMSGHYFFRSNDNYDDGLYASLMLASILVRESEPLSYLLERLPVSPSLYLRMDCPDGKKRKVIDKIKKRFRSHKMVLIDGVGIIFKNGFALLRPSNTEDKLELRIEADSEADLLRIEKEMKRELRSAMR